MANRVMAAKALKLRNQKRRYPRKMDLDKRGPRPNREVIGEYRSRARGIADLDVATRFDGVPAGKYDVNSRLREIVSRFDKLMFVLHIDNPAQRIRIYFNSRQDEIIIQRIFKRRQVYCLSKKYTSIDDAYFALENNVVSWNEERSFPNQQDTHAPLP